MKIDLDHAGSAIHNMKKTKRRWQLSAVQEMFLTLFANQLQVWATLTTISSLQETSMNK